jgi:hypothetical protein
MTLNFWVDEFVLHVMRRVIWQVEILVGEGIFSRL